MYLIIISTMTRKTLRGRKFDNITYSENGLLLHCKNKPEVEIPFNNLNKMYIKKFSLNPLIELLGISIPFLFVVFAIQYLDLYLLVIACILIALLIFKIVINHKWYRFYVVLKDGTAFSKRVQLNQKSENMSLLEKVYTEYLYRNFNSMTSA